MIEKHSRHQMNSIRIDNGGEFILGIFKRFFKSHRMMKKFMHLL